MKKLALLTIGILASALALFSVLTGCARPAETPAVEPSPGMPAPAPAPTPPSGPIIGQPPSFDDASSGSGLPETSVDRLIIRTGDMSIVVTDVLVARDQISSLAERLGGFVVSSNIYGEEASKTGFVSIRVPAESFEAALAEIRSLAVRVTAESTSSQDITEEYIDLQSRLRNAETTESQYLALLEQSTTVEDTLSIYQALTSIRYDIEQIKGRIQYLDRSVEMSQISVNLVPEVSLEPIVSPEWSLPETLNSALRGLTTFGQGLGTAFIWIGIFSPIWGTALGIALWRRHRRKKLAQSQPAK